MEYLLAYIQAMPRQVWDTTALGRKPKFKLRHYQSCASVEPYYNCAKISSLISAFE